MCVCVAAAFPAAQRKIDRAFLLVPVARRFSRDPLTPHAPHPSHAHTRTQVGNPGFAIVDEAYPYISKRLLTDDSPRLREALRYMIYGKSNVFDVERLIDLLQVGVELGGAGRVKLRAYVNWTREKRSFEKSHSWAGCMGRRHGGGTRVCFHAVRFVPSVRVSMRDACIAAVFLHQTLVKNSGILLTLRSPRLLFACAGPGVLPGQGRHDGGSTGDATVASAAGSSTSSRRGHGGFVDVTERRAGGVAVPVREGRGVFPGVPPGRGEYFF